MFLHIRSLTVLALLSTATLAFAGGAAWSGARHVEMSLEEALYRLDIAQQEPAQALLAQARVKALVGRAVAALARQAAGDDDAATDARAFLRALVAELHKVLR